MSIDTQCLCGCALAESVEPQAPIHQGIAAQRSAPTVGILGCGKYLPEQVVPNDVVAIESGVEASWIERKTGIMTRRRAEPGQAASDLAEPAATEALRNAGLTAEDLSLIVVATSTPDSPQPPTACVLQNKLGAWGAAAFDLNAVCSGFVFALETARRMIADGGYALVVGVDIYSRILDHTDHRTAVLFGDGAGAVVLGPSSRGRGIIETRLASFGAHTDLIKVPGGGSRILPTKESLAAGNHFFAMDGRGVRDFVEREVPPAVSDFLASVRVEPSAIAHLIPHQANGQMLQDLVPQLGLTSARTHYTVERYGNTGAASVAVTLAEAHTEINAGDLVLLAAFGGGMAIGLTLLRW